MCIVITVAILRRIADLGLVSKADPVLASKADLVLASKAYIIY